MRFIDRVLQNWRARKARRWISRGACVLDIGCHQGEFLRGLGDYIGPSVGYDPLTEQEGDNKFHFVRELFPVPSPYPDESFDVVVMLATLEHIHEKGPFAEEFFRILKPGGRVIITVPSQWVDNIVHTLVRLGLADGMSLEEHHGFDPRTTPDIFGRRGFELERWRRFQLGLNHLFVFRKPLTVAAPAPYSKALAYAC